MNTSWIGPRIIIGPSATESYYYDRPAIVGEIWDELEKGNYVLLAAPRRVGKTSVMRAMSDSVLENAKCVFCNIQGIRSEEEFYKRFYELILYSLSTLQQSRAWIKDFFKSINIQEITLSGVKFGVRKDNYLSEIYSVLEQLKVKDIKIILFLDELPEVLHNLFKNGKAAEASSILDRLREWRQNDLRENLGLVLAGSVGIHHVVKTIEGRTSDLNDLKTIEFAPLSDTEALDYVAWATLGATIQYDDVLKTYLLGKIHFHLPYFINLMLDEIDKAARKTTSTLISAQAIDTAFDKIVKNSDHFKEWKNRLYDYFPAADSAFLNEVLTYIAHKEAINSRQLYDLASKHTKQQDYIEFMDGLERDGYITERDDTYVFVSPFLKAFWKRSNPVYHD